MGNKWPGIQDEIKASKKEVMVFPVDQVCRQALKERRDISKTSTLGTVLNNCGGIVVENWIRIYGSVTLDFTRRSALWNQDRIIVAEDVLGGLFGGMEDGTLGYFAPSTLVWEPLHITYPQFLSWCLQKRTNMFYELQRWKSWKQDAAALTMEEGFAVTPELWRLGSPVEERERKVVPISELVRGLLTAAEKRTQK